MENSHCRAYCENEGRSPGVESYAIAIHAADIAVRKTKTSHAEVEERIMTCQAAGKHPNRFSEGIAFSRMQPSQKAHLSSTSGLR